MLKANNGNLLRTARELSIPRPTLREWAINNRRNTPEVSAIQHQKEETLVQRYAQAERLYLDRALDPAAIAETNGLSAMKAAGIARDKQQLLNGDPTAIHATVMSDDERQFRIAELITRLRTRAAGQQPTPLPAPV